ncbi:heat intolerant 4-like protein, partial [Tanacetum coccineum]
PIKCADILIPIVIVVSKSNFFEVTLEVIFLSSLILCTIEHVVSPFPPSDKIGLISVQRESESRKVVDMKQMKMDWVPYVPLGKRAGLKLLKDERVAEFTYCIPSLSSLAVPELDVSPIASGDAATCDVSLFSEAGIPDIS